MSGVVYPHINDNYHHEKVPTFNFHLDDGKKSDEVTSPPTDITPYLLKKPRSVSQRAIILKFLSVAKNGKVHYYVDEERSQKLRELLSSVKDSLVGSYSNYSLVTALMGSVTFASYLVPIIPFDQSDGANNRNNQLLEAFQIMLIISTLLSFVCILLCSTFNLAISIFLIADEDLVWFALSIPSVFLCWIIMLMAVLSGISSLCIVSLFLCSIRTATICIVIICSFVLLYLLITALVLKKLFHRVNLRFDRQVELLTEKGK